eukprot:COSAG04_NODE_1195_length_7783_cov_2.866085_6_plen_369_part_00
MHPELRKVEWSCQWSLSAGDYHEGDPLGELANVLMHAGNSNLREIAISGPPAGDCWSSARDEAFRLEARGFRISLGRTNVVCVTTHGGAYFRGSDRRAIDAVCANNALGMLLDMNDVSFLDLSLFERQFCTLDKARHEQYQQRLAGCVQCFAMRTCRPLQRLLLCAMYERPAGSAAPLVGMPLHLSSDIFDLVRGYLDKSTLCPRVDHYAEKETAAIELFSQPTARKKQRQSGTVRFMLEGATLFSLTRGDTHNLLWLGDFGWHDAAANSGEGESDAEAMVAHHAARLPPGPMRDALQAALQQPRSRQPAHAQMAQPRSLPLVAPVSEGAAAPGGGSKQMAEPEADDVEVSEPVQFIFGTRGKRPRDQ